MRNRLICVFSRIVRFVTCYSLPLAYFFFNKHNTCVEIHGHWLSNEIGHSRFQQIDACKMDTLVCLVTWFSKCPLFLTQLLPNVSFTLKRKPPTAFLYIFGHRCYCSRFFQKEHVLLPQRLLALLL